MCLFGGMGWPQVHVQADCETQCFGVGLHCSLCCAVDENLGAPFTFSFSPKSESATSILNIIWTLFKRLKTALL